MMTKEKNQCPECLDFFESLKFGQLCPDCHSGKRSYVPPEPLKLSRLAYLQKTVIAAASIPLALIVLYAARVFVETPVYSFFNVASEQEIHLASTALNILVVAIPFIFMCIRFLMTLLHVTSARLRDAGFGAGYSFLILLPIPLGFLLPAIFGGNPSPTQSLFSAVAYFVSVSPLLVCFFAPTDSRTRLARIFG